MRPGSLAEDNSAADHFLDTVYEKNLLLAGRLLLGRFHSELASHLRGFPISTYIDLRCPTQDGIEVARVLHRLAVRELNRVISDSKGHEREPALHILVGAYTGATEDLDLVTFIRSLARGPAR
jgi:plasmid stabilization system protein ParE